MAELVPIPIKFYALKERDYEAHKDKITEAGVVSFSERHIRLGIGNGKSIRYDDETRATFVGDNQPSDNEAVAGDTWYKSDTKELYTFTYNDAGELEWVLTDEDAELTQQVVASALEIENFNNFIENLVKDTATP